MLNESLKEQVADAIATIQNRALQAPLILVFGLGSYGDVIQITPLLQALHRKFPQAGLILLHNDLLGAKLLESAPYLTEYIRLRSSLHYLLRSLLRDKGYDLLVESRYVIKYTLPSNPRFSAEEIQFIRDAQTAQKPWLSFVGNFPYDNDILWREAKSKGWSMYDLMANTAGFGGEDFEELRIELPQNKPASPKTPLPKKYIVVSNSAEWLPLQSTLWTKSLPHAKMRDVLRELKAAAIPTVLLGTTNDPGDYPVDYDLRGKTNLLEAAEIVANARLLLGPEGGLVNLAKAVGTPSVVFFGSTPVEFFRFKSNINIEPRFCGGCWWSTESYLRQCPLLENIPPCTDSLDIQKITRSVRELFSAKP
jgi:ADP-heptose:LPS heptosyltransferase